MRRLLAAPFALFAALWLASWLSPGSISIARSHCYFAALEGNELSIGVSRQRQMLLDGNGWAGTSPVEIEYSPYWTFHCNSDARSLQPGILAPPDQWSSHWGRYDRNGSAIIESGVAFTMPLWILLAMSTLPLFPLARRYLRHREGMPNPNHCARCGYDLRATPARCPECGAVPGA